VSLWQEIIGDLPKDVALRAVLDHLREQPDVWLQPGHVWQRARSLLNYELGREPAELRDARRAALDCKAAPDDADSHALGWPSEAQPTTGQSADDGMSALRVRAVVALRRTGHASAAAWRNAPSAHRPGPRRRGRRRVNWDSMSALIRGIPDLPGARCKGRADLFEATVDEQRITPSGEPKYVPRAEIQNARTAAMHLCETCPSRTACGAWIATLRPSRRPRGVVAGQLITSSGLPRKTGTPVGPTANGGHTSSGRYVHRPRLDGEVNP
jgi:WhiB family redox-sensing transcriptional regulator